MRNYNNEPLSLNEVLQHLHNYVNDISNLNKENAKYFLSKYQDWKYQYTNEIDDELEGKLALFIDDEEADSRLKKYLSILNSITSQNIEYAVLDISSNSEWGNYSKKEERELILKGKEATEAFLEGAIERRMRFNNLPTLQRDSTIPGTLNEIYVDDIVESIFGFFKENMTGGESEYKRFLTSLTSFIENEIIPDDNFRKFTLFLKTEELRYTFYALLFHKQNIDRRNLCKYMKRSFTNFDAVDEDTLYKKLSNAPSYLGSYMPQIILDFKASQEAKNR